VNTRPLIPNESENLAVLNRAGIESVLLFITETGLRKSIMDATEPMRRLLKANGVHDFALQLQGPENKVLLGAKLLTNADIVDVPLSLYRPVTKHGDPRMWFYGFSAFADPDDVLAVFVVDGVLHAHNLTKSSIALLIKSKTSNPATRLVQQLFEAKSSVARELLQRLQELAKAGPIKAVCEGDTAIGRSIESALGIAINSRPEPDYKGIEIKSGRSQVLKSRENRATLFACVPDWNLSNLKSSREILERFGYERAGQFRLYCTVSTRSANPQGLQLELSEIDGWLREFSATHPVEQVCIWTLDRLHKKLVDKHSETFWIKASAGRARGRESFTLESVIHTSAPSVSQFDRLISDGTITMDHLIKRVRTDGASERGPLFKIDRKRLSELFLGEPEYYSLTV
jgi:hypothetical protein